MSATNRDEIVRVPAPLNHSSVSHRSISQYWSSPAGTSLLKIVYFKSMTMNTVSSLALRGDTPKPFLPGPEILLHIIKVYLKTIRFDTLEIVFECTLFRKKKIFFFRKFLKCGEVCHCNTDISAILKVFWLIFLLNITYNPYKTTL